MKNRFSFLIFLMVFLSGNVFAQTRASASNTPKDVAGTIWGIFESDSAGMALPGANVRLLRAADSSLVKGMATGPDGRFLFSGVQQGDYILSASFLGHLTSFIPVPATRFRGNRNIDLGKITLRESAIALSGAVIEGQAPEVVVKEDTLEYNPAAFKVQEGSVVEDLLKRMPGIEVEADGAITSAGRSVRRVTVNGKEFFGNDPRMATQNLTVEMIDKVQVIEKQTEQSILTGVDDGETETIINLVIKKNMMKGWMGNITAGMGALVDNRNNEGPRYTAQGRLMKFTEETQTTFIVNGNNINRQGFTDGGNAVRMNSGGGGDRGGGGGGGGITNSHSFGFNSSTVISEKLRIGGDLSYNFSETFSNRNSFRTNLLIDSVSYRKSESKSENNSHNFVVNGRVEYKPDSVYNIVFVPRLSYNLSNSHSHSLQETFAGDEYRTDVNSSDATTGMKSNGLNLSGDLTISRSFAKKSRRLSLAMSGNLNHSSGNGTNLSDSRFFLQEGRDRFLNQESQTSTNTYSYNIRATYVEPLRENLNLQLSYNIRQNGTRNIRETYDYDGVNFSSLNTDYSKSLDNRFVTQTIGVTLNGTHEKYNYTAGVNIVPSYTQSTSFIKNGISEGVDSTLNHIKGRKVINYAPQVNFTYRFTRQTNLRFTYRGNTSQPSVTQLDPTLNVTNPLNIRSGNPDLLPSFSNNMSLRFNTNQRETQRSLTATVDYSFTLNEIINYTTNDYDPETGDIRPGTGIQHTAPINENGSWRSSGNIMFSTPIGSSKRFRFNATTQLGYRNQIGYTTVRKQSQRNITITTNVSENIGLSYNKNWFYGQLRANVRFSNSTYSLEGKEGKQDANFGITYNTQLTLPWSMGINSDINYRAQRGLSEGYNKDEVIWNAGISKQFLKGNRATLKVEWTDILQQRLNISRNVTANYIEDSEYNALTGYVMVTFSYRFNNTTGIRNRSRDDYQNRPQREEGQDRPGGGNFRDGGGQRGDMQRGGGGGMQGGGGGRIR